MNDNQKHEIYYKIWEHHSNLLWNKVQHMLVIFGGIFAAWFLLIERIINVSSFSLLYLIVNVLLCLFGMIICFYLRKLVDRDIKMQDYAADKIKLFGETKTLPENDKRRGRTIIRSVLRLCLLSFIILLVLAITIYVFGHIANYN